MSTDSWWCIKAR